MPRSVRKAVKRAGSTESAGQVIWAARKAAEGSWGLMARL